MDHLSYNSPSMISFKQIYLENISPKLEAIDLLIKTTENYFLPQDIAHILGMSTDDVFSIMHDQNIKEVTLLDFFTIMSYSKSYICGLIRRQWKYAATPLYTPYMISYIYELNIDKVQAIFDQQEKEYILESELMSLFDLIHSPIYRF